MKKTIKAYRCEHCDKIIDPEKDFYVNIHGMTADVNMPTDEKKHEVVTVRVHDNNYWRNEEATAVCSEACMSNWINALARESWVNLKTAQPPSPPVPEPNEPIQTIGEAS